MFDERALFYQRYAIYYVNVDNFGFHESYFIGTCNLVLVKTGLTQLSYVFYMKKDACFGCVL